MNYKATATTGEEVFGEYIHREEIQGYLCEDRIVEQTGLEHDIIIDTLQVLHKGEYKPINYYCDGCEDPFYSEELNSDAESGTIDPPYICPECDNAEYWDKEYQDYLENEINNILKKEGE